MWLGFLALGHQVDSLLLPQVPRTQEDEAGSAGSGSTAVAAQAGLLQSRERLPQTDRLPGLDRTGRDSGLVKVASALGCESKS